MTNAEARFNNSLRPRKPEGSLGRTAQDVHLDSHTAPELWCVSVAWGLPGISLLNRLPWAVRGGGGGLCMSIQRWMGMVFAVLVQMRRRSHGSS